MVHRGTGNGVDETGGRADPDDQLSYEGWNFNSGNYLFTTDTK